MHLMADGTQRRSGGFSLDYRVDTQNILSTVLHDANTGSFSLMVAPPPADNLAAKFGKHVVFIIDRSGSMTGPPMQQAKVASFCARAFRPSTP